MIQTICDCTPEQRNYMALLLWGLGIVLVLVMGWVFYRAWLERKAMLAEIADSPFAYEVSGSSYLVREKRTGKTVFEARSEGEAIGWIRQMSQAETVNP